MEHVGAADAVQERTAAVWLVSSHGHAARAVTAAGAVRTDLAALAGYHGNDHHGNQQQQR